MCCMEYAAADRVIAWAPCPRLSERDGSRWRLKVMSILSLTIEQRIHNDTVAWLISFCFLSEARVCDVGEERGRVKLEVLTRKSASFMNEQVQTDWKAGISHKDCIQTT